MLLFRGIPTPRHSALTHYLVAFPLSAIISHGRRGRQLSPASRFPDPFERILTPHQLASEDLPRTACAYG